MTIQNPVDWSKLPIPVDDGRASHLEGAELPSIDLHATDGRAVDLSRLAGTAIVYAYPLTTKPGTPAPDGWDAIPGARGCTPQSCSFRDHVVELDALGVDHIFGLSTQDTSYQQERSVVSICLSRCFRTRACNLPGRCTFPRSRCQG